MGIRKKTAMEYMYGKECKTGSEKRERENENHCR